MLAIFTYLRKYWRKHKLSAVNLMFSAVLMTAVLVCSLLIYRGENARKIYDGYDLQGFFDVAWTGVDDTTLAKIQADSHLTTGYMDVIGKGGNSVLQYTVGSLFDEKNLSRIQFDSGKMPENSSEIAITRQVLNNLNWLGKVGENITLNINDTEKTFKVTGIISEKYGQNWSGSEVTVIPGESAGEYPIPQIFISNADCEQYESQYNVAMILENISDFQRYKNQNNNEIREEYIDRYYNEDIVSLHGSHNLIETNLVVAKSTKNSLRWFFYSCLDFRDYCNFKCLHRSKTDF